MKSSRHSGNRYWPEITYGMRANPWLRSSQLILMWRKMPPSSINVCVDELDAVTDASAPPGKFARRTND